MPDNFDSAIEVVLKHEGGYVNDVVDPGGATNFGISFYWLKQCGELDLADVNHDGRVDIEDIKALTRDEAKLLYRKLWWDHYGYQAIVGAPVATKIFDMAVNMGGIQAHKIVQRALNSCAIVCTVDGLLGPITMDRLNKVNQDYFLFALRRQCGEFYRALVQSKPQFRKYITGWLLRAAS